MSITCQIIKLEQRKQNYNPLVYFDYKFFIKSASLIFLIAIQQI